MRTYTKLLFTILPLVFFSLFAAVWTSYYFSSNALIDLAEIWLQSRLDEAITCAGPISCMPSWSAPI